jgi:hypothetical protein
MPVEQRPTPNRKPIDTTTREYVALTKASDQYQKYNRMFLWSVAGLAYAAFCDFDPARYEPLRAIGIGSLVLLTASGYSILGGLCLILVPLLFFGRRSASRELNKAAEAWKRTDE